MQLATLSPRAHLWVTYRSYMATLYAYYIHSHGAPRRRYEPDQHAQVAMTTLARDSS